MKLKRILLPWTAIRELEDEAERLRSGYEELKRERRELNELLNQVAEGCTPGAWCAGCGNSYQVLTPRGWSFATLTGCGLSRCGNYVPKKAEAEER